VDAVPIPVHPDLRYFAFNKPRGVTTTLRDPHAARSLQRFLPPGPSVFPVGRLDRESEGLLLLTNDGDLALRLQHPRYGVEKEYLAEVAGAVSGSALGRLRRGVRLEDGMARAIRVRTAHSTGERAALSIVMGEGRKREVRRMLAAVGLPVKRLVRTRVGPVRLGRLKPGELRALSPREITRLYEWTNLRRAGLARRPDGRGAGRTAGGDG
jgi:pseudouridine synthase